jgi:uncharacterized protein
MIDELERKTGAEIGILVVNGLDGADEEDYANGVFREWGIGKKGKDNGILLLVAVKDRAMRIEVGYGLEPLIPDGLAGEIRDRQMIPSFRAGNYGQGLLEATARIARIIAASEGVSLEKASVPKRRGLPGGQTLLFFAFTIPFITLGFMGIGSAIKAFVTRKPDGCFPLVWGLGFGGIPFVASVGPAIAHGLWWFWFPQFVIAIAALVFGFTRPLVISSRSTRRGGWGYGGGGFGGGFGGSSGGGGGFGGGSSGGGGASGHW